MASARLARAVAVGGFVAQRAAQADFAERLLDAVQASRAGVGAGVVIDQRAHAALGRIDQADQRAVVDVVFVQGAVQPPPELLQDLAGNSSAARPGERDAAGQRAVEMGVAVDQGGHQQPAPGIHDFSSGPRRTAPALHRADGAVRANLDAAANPARGWRRRTSGRARW